MKSWCRNPRSPVCLSHVRRFRCLLYVFICVEFDFWFFVKQPTFSNSLFMFGSPFLVLAQTGYYCRLAVDRARLHSDGEHRFLLLGVHRHVSQVPVAQISWLVPAGTLRSLIVWIFVFRVVCVAPKVLSVCLAASFGSLLSYVCPAESCFFFLLCKLLRYYVLVVYNIIMNDCRMNDGRVVLLTESTPRTSRKELYKQASKREGRGLHYCCADSSTPDSLAVVGIPEFSGKYGISSTGVDIVCVAPSSLQVYVPGPGVASHAHDRASCD